jgi:3-oxoadipate enol-lactonase
MPYADCNGTRLYYVEDGDPEAPALVFTHSLGTDADLWAPQVAAVADRFRVIRYDTRGHGLSSLPEGTFGFAALAEDLIGLLDHLGIARAHLCGTSMGGMTILQAAHAHPERVDRLVLCNTTARIGSAEGWAARIALVEERGLAAIATTLVSRWVDEDFPVREPARFQALCDMLRRTPAAGYNGSCAALRDDDLWATVKTIAAPALVVAGETDLAVTAEQAARLAATLPDARQVILPAAHTGNWERPEAFNAAVTAFLA